jgi:hypothetical protein
MTAPRPSDIKSAHRSLYNRNEPFAPLSADRIGFYADALYFGIDMGRWAVLRYRQTLRQELAGQSVCSLVADGRGGVLAIVGGHSLCRRSGESEWTTITTSEAELSCCVPIGNVVFVGTSDARILNVDADGAQPCLRGFDAVQGRHVVRRSGADRWQAQGAAAWNSLDGGNLRWYGSSSQRPCRRSSALNGLRLNLAAHNRDR